MNNITTTQEYTWGEIARDSQKIPAGNWTYWLIMAGRGFGKTRTGAETVMELVHSGQYKNIGIIGKTIQEARYIMVENSNSGIMSTSLANEDNIKFYSSKKQIIWENGARATLLGADNYDSLRGYQFDLIWVDEFAKFKYPKEVWEQINFTLRLGDDTKCIITTTPKPLQILIDISKTPMTHLTQGSTFENSQNLGTTFIESMRMMYSNTGLGRQELFGEIIMDNDNNMWREGNIIYKKIDRDSLSRVVIGVDPAVTNNENSDETGIVVAGLGNDNKIYILDDLSGKYKSNEWAKIVANAYFKYEADRVVAEVNNGGDLVEGMLKNVSEYIPFSPVRAIRGKTKRAEPIALLYEAGKVYHSQIFDTLEKQMKNIKYDGETGGKDDRVDALVWSISEITSKKHNRVSISLL